MSEFAKPKLVAAFAAALLTLAAGCGGSGSTAQEQNRSTNPFNQKVSGPTGSATFTVNWPKPDSRVVPPGTNRIIVYVGAVDMPSPRAIILNRPINGGGTSRVRVEGIPAGPARLFAAQARQVPKPGTPDVEQNITDYRRLLEGKLLAGGAAPTVDLRPGQAVDITIDLEAPNNPPNGVTQVDGTLNQIVADSFPTVLAFQNVRDQNGDPITQVNIGNFQVFEDGVECAVVDVRTSAQAQTDIKVSMVLDRSGSMDGQPLKDLKTAATTFVNLLQPKDEVAIVSFANAAVIDVPLTADRANPLAAIQRLDADGGTALYDGVFTGGETLKGTGGRKAIIAMTDGEENSSSRTLAEAIQNATAANAPIFAVGLGSINVTPLQAMADQTNGAFYVSPSSNELEEIYLRIRQQLDAQIQISFVSPRPQRLGVSRVVRVKLVNYGNFTFERTATYTM